MRRRAAERLPVTIDSGVTSSFCLGCLVTRASIELATLKIRSSRAVRVPQNSGRRSERIAVTEGHQTGKNSRMRQVTR